MINILFEINSEEFPQNLHIEKIIHHKDHGEINLTQEAMCMAMEYALEVLKLEYTDFGIPITNDGDNEEFDIEFICKINNQIYNVRYSSFDYYYKIDEIKI